jgi:lantibiotic modifying enzyme
MRANAQLSLLAERLFSGSTYDELLRSALVEEYSLKAARRVREESGLDAESLCGEAWMQMRQSVAESLAWMLPFRIPREHVQDSIDAWVGAQCEMLRRVAADRAEIEARFGLAARRILSLDLDLSDRHGGGRSVSALTFDSGLRLIYKPRDSGIEAWFADFQTRLNELGAPFPFRPLRVLPREGYGWMEFVAHRRCRDGDELRGFYRNAGALLCLLHLLRATDCHFENLIACGESPVFVDAETLFQPSLSLAGEASSVVRTGMLSRLMPALPSAVPRAEAELGALSCVSPQAVTVLIPAFQGAAHRLETVLLTPETNIPFPLGRDPAPESFVEEMVDGFCRTWQFISGDREAVLTMIEAARSARIRYVLRDTLTYYQTIVAALCAGDLYGLTLPALAGAKSIFAALKEFERLELRRLDIPRFTLRACETGMFGVADCFSMSGYEIARRGIQSISDREMEKQVAVIRVSWGFYGAGKSFALMAKG